MYVNRRVFRFNLLSSLAFLSSFGLLARKAIEDWDDNGKRQEFPNRPRGRRRPRSAVQESQSRTNDDNDDEEDQENHWAFTPPIFACLPSANCHMKQVVGSGPL
jgi:hypothetical protein